MTETVLISLPQHSIKLIFRLFRWVMFAIISGGIAYFFLPLFGAIASAIAVLIVGFFLEKDRFKNSVLELTDERVLLRVKKGLFSSFEVGLHYEQIVNCTYEKTNFFHAMTKSGTLFVRVNERKEGQIIAEFVPNVEKVCAVINAFLKLSREDRKKSVLIHQLFSSVK